MRNLVSCVNGNYSNLGQRGDRCMCPYNINYLWVRFWSRIRYWSIETPTALALNPQSA